MTITYILDHGLDNLAATYASDGVRTRVLDVSSSSYCQGAVDEAGQVDILINNAGASTGLIRDEHLNRSVDLDDVTPDFWDYFVGTNFFGPWCLIRACVPAMRARKWGRVINVTTSLSAMLRAIFHPYGPAKAGMEAMSAGHAGRFAKD